MQNVFAVIDTTNLTVDEINRYTIFQNLCNMADVVVLNKTDLADQSNLKALHDYAGSLYPPKQSVVITQQSVIDNALLYVNTKKALPAKNIIKAQASHHSDQTHNKPNVQIDDLFDLSIDLPGLVKRHAQHQISTLSIGWVFEPNVSFNWKSLQLLFTTFDNQPFIKRAKGVFRVGKPWMLFQWVNNQTTREMIAYRRDSRFEILMTEENTFDLHKFELELKNCIQSV